MGISFVPLVQIRNLLRSNMPEKELKILGKCIACERKTVPPNHYCTFHERGYSEVKSIFSAWVGAFGSISWERYLETIIGLKETGVWAAEVARIELRHLEQGLISNQPSEDTGSKSHGD